jgi:hypothetical protein
MDTNPFLNESSAQRRPALHAVSNALLNDPLLNDPLLNDPDDDEAILRQALRSGRWIASSVRSAAAAVGGLDALEQLDAEPLPADPLCMDVFGATQRALLHEVEVLLGAPTMLYDSEYVVIAHRILERIAVNQPGLLDRVTADRLAAAVMWLVLRGNGVLHQRRDGLSASEVWAHFGVSNASDRGRSMYRHLGLQWTDEWSRWGRRTDTWLCDPTLLHSSARRTLIEERTSLETLCRRELERERLSRPFQRVGNQVRITARPVVLSGALPSLDDDGRQIVLMMFGGTILDPDEVLVLALDDAERLAQLLDRALELVV